MTAIDMPAGTTCGWPHSNCKTLAVLFCSFIKRWLCAAHAESFGCNGNATRCVSIALAPKKGRR